MNLTTIMKTTSATHLCDKHHAYDTGLFDSISRTLINGINLVLKGGASENSHSNPSSKLSSSSEALSGSVFDTEPVDNIITVVVIWFIIGVIIVLVIGIIVLALLSAVSGDYHDDGGGDDEEKQLMTTIDDEYEGDDDDDYNNYD